MIKNLHRIEWFVGLALLQVLVFNQLHIGGYATPFLYIYFILKFNSKVGRNQLMLWAFMIGLTVDVFGNTPTNSKAQVLQNLQQELQVHLLRVPPAFL